MRTFLVLAAMVSGFVATTAPYGHAVAAPQQFDPNCGSAIAVVRSDRLSAAALQLDELPRYALLSQSAASFGDNVVIDVVGFEQPGQPPPPPPSFGCAFYSGFWSADNFGTLLDVEIVAYASVDAAHQRFAAAPAANFAPSATVAASISSIGDESVDIGLAPVPAKELDTAARTELRAIVFRRGTVVVRLLSVAPPGTVSDGQMQSWAALIDGRLGNGLP